MDRLFSNSRLPTVDTIFLPVLEEIADHEAVEVSLCDEGMCFTSEIRHNIGAVLLVDFAPEASDNDHSLRSEAVVVDCHSCCGGHRGGGYEITVIFTGN